MISEQGSDIHRLHTLLELSKRKLLQAIHLQGLPPPNLKEAPRNKPPSSSHLFGSSRRTLSVKVVGGARENYQMAQIC